MNSEEFWKRFRKQYTDQEWERLNSYPAFKKAIAELDKSKAGLAADEFLIGEATSKEQAKRLKDDQRKWGLDAAKW